MTGWFLHGLRTGVKTTGYPRRPETSEGTRIGFPTDTDLATEAEARALVERCPTGALRAEGSRVAVDRRLCVHCFRCVRGETAPMNWGPATQPFRAVPAGDRGNRGGSTGRVGSAFRRSLHLLVVDAGDCGACLNEVKQLNAPQYNMHRLGFFITPTPRDADVLLVVGQGTDAMREPLLAAYRAMPDPKWVVAVGSCAVGGVPVGPSFAAGAGIHEVLPVDIEIPGSPPTPLAILQSLLVLSGRETEGREREHDGG